MLILYIEYIKVNNFRLLKNSTMSFKDNNDDLCLLIGKNNSGKTSLIVLFEKFFGPFSFDYNDFSLELRDLLDNIDESTNVVPLAIQLILRIKYESEDDLSYLSEFIMDLDPDKNSANILFECGIRKDKLIEALKNNTNISKVKFIRKYLSQFLERNIYTFENDEDLELKNRNRLVKKELDMVCKLIDVEIVHAKRNVESSEEKTSHRILSELTTKYYNGCNSVEPSKFETINQLIDKMDEDLEKQYQTFFAGFVKNAKDFLSLDELKVVSNLKANEILTDSSEVVYGDSNNYLPEYLNGLGYMNILYLLLSIEIKKSIFIASKKDINLLFIEEPEAHTHPQLQYIFARKVEQILKGVPGLQTIITTHSPHIVANHPFENIRYMMADVNNSGHKNIEIKNFYQELSEKYKDEKDEFLFLKEYLSIESAELFFASKVIFIEGVSENILMPYFISKYDELCLKKEQDDIAAGKKEKAEYIPISSQNITIMEVGANAKAFRHFLEFLNTKTLIITDIDTNMQQKSAKGNISYTACAVADKNACRSSNETLAYYYDAPTFSSDANSDYRQWLRKLIKHTAIPITDVIKVVYQSEENHYQARSFEDAFLNVNRSNFTNNLVDLLGVKNVDDYNETGSNVYSITDSILSKKSDFASSILFNAHTKNTDWKIPYYIWEGLEWIQKS